MAGMAERQVPASVLSRVIVDNEQLGRDPLTRPAPAEENAGSGPPSPQGGEGRGSEGVLSTIKWDRTLACVRCWGFAGICGWGNCEWWIDHFLRVIY